MQKQVYQSESLLLPNSDSESTLSRLQSAIGGLSVGSYFGSDTKSIGDPKITLEVMKSRSFMYQFIEKYDLVLDVIGVTGWDQEKNSLIYNSSVYDSDRMIWNSSFEKTDRQKTEMAYKQLSKLIKLDYDTATGLIRMSVSHQSPFVAQQLSESYIAEVNAHIRDMEVRQAEKSLSYLKQQLNDQGYKELESSIYSLMEEQLKIIMYAKAKRDYVFQVVDYPSLAIEPVARSLLLWAILGATFGVLCVCVVILFNPAKFDR